jgi:hypothetical protein
MYMDETARLLGGPPGGGGGAPMLTTRLRSGGGVGAGVSDVSELAIGARIGGAGGGATFVRLGIGGARTGSEGACEAAPSDELPAGRGGAGGAARTGVLGTDDGDNAALDGRGGGGGAARKEAPADGRTWISGAGRREGRAGGPAEAAFEAFFNVPSKKNESWENILTRPWRSVSHIEGIIDTGSGRRGWRATW